MFDEDSFPLPADDQNNLPHPPAWQLGRLGKEREEERERGGEGSGYLKKSQDLG